MPLKDFLVPEEKVKFVCRSDIQYANKRYDLFITNKRILLYRESGFINKSEDVICEKIERLQGLEYKEKGGLLNFAKISINGGIRLDIKGPSKEVKNMFKILECLINSK